MRLPILSLASNITVGLKCVPWPPLHKHLLPGRYVDDTYCVSLRRVYIAKFNTRITNMSPTTVYIPLPTGRTAAPNLSYYHDYIDTRDAEILVATIMQWLQVSTV